MSNFEYEEMSHFFDERANIYDEHMRNNIAEYDAFYKNVINQIEATDKPIYIHSGSRPPTGRSSSG
jgi:predicted TIM-barrel fold metal-dependent hydrolase